MEVPPSIGQPLNSEAEASRSFHIECADHDQKKNFEAVPIDTYFAAIGEFGFYQKRHFVLVGSGWLALATGMLSMVFTNHRPNWRYPGGEVQTSELPCADMASGQVVELINTWHSTAGEWNLVCEHQWKATLLDSLFFVGVGFGAAWLGGLGDTLGRRKGYIIANVVLLCASLVSAASPSFEVYVILRIFVGVGVGGSGGITYCYMAEFMGASWQAIIGVAQSGVFFSTAGLLLAAMSYAVPGWRYLTLATSLVPACLVAIVVCCRIPDSPRWLLAQGKTLAATSVMQEIARGNGTEVPKGMVLSNVSSATGDRVHPSMLFSGVLFRRSLYMLYIWFATSFVFYGLYMNSNNLGGSLHISFALQAITEVPALFLGAWMLDAHGRRVTLSLSMLLSGVACTACMFLTKVTHITAFALLGRFGIAIHYACLYVYVSELFPTSVRSLAFGICSLAARIGGVSAPGNIFLARFHQTLPLAVLGVFALIGGLLHLRLPETLGKPLPQSLKDCQSARYDVPALGSPTMRSAGNRIDAVYQGA
mmetsp:Transcript_99459/g.186882  ORF Transcript_99459/g.186882 Transcript_99459/m.186882 type:complete len:536 (+) Transcript_99459:76-1683(+)